MGTVTMTSTFSGTVERGGEQIPVDFLPPFDGQPEWLAADLRTTDGYVALTESEWEQVPAFVEHQSQQR